MVIYLLNHVDIMTIAYLTKQHQLKHKTARQFVQIICDEMILGACNELLYSIALLMASFLQHFFVNVGQHLDFNFLIFVYLIELYQCQS